MLDALPTPNHPQSTNGSRIAVSWLAAAAVAEARLTHRHGEALATAAAVALLARQLLSGDGIAAACQRALERHRSGPGMGGGKWLIVTSNQDFC